VHAIFRYTFIEGKPPVTDLAGFNERLRASFSSPSVPEVSHELLQSGITSWDFGDLPAHVELNQANLRVRGYPALVDEGQSVAIRIMDSQLSANRASEDGLQRLIMLALADQRKYLEKNIPGFQQMALFYATRGSRAELLDMLVHAIFRYTFIEGKPPVTDLAGFNERLRARAHLVDTANVTAGLVRTVLETTLQIERTLKSAVTDINRPVFADIERQLARLVGPSFLQGLPSHALKEFPRYLRAIEYRIEKLQGNLDRDRRARDELDVLESRYWSLDDGGRRALDRYRWMLEEYRVSLFAQPVGTSVPVSAKRLAKEWETSINRVGEGLP